MEILINSKDAFSLTFAELDVIFDDDALKRRIDKMLKIIINDPGNT